MVIVLFYFHVLCETEVESRTQGSRLRPRTQKKSGPRPRTAFPRTDTLEAKDRNARGQGQGPRTQAQVLSKKGLHKNFSGDLQKKKGLPKNFSSDLHKILTIQKIVLSSSRGQANFRGLEARGQGQGLQNVSSRTPPLM